MNRALAALATGAILLGTGIAGATPSRWARARDPALDRQQTLLADAEALEIRAHQKESRGDEAIYLQRARDLLEQGGFARARDPVLRFRLAELYGALQEDEKAIALFVALLRDDPPAPIRAEAYSALAISYARLGRHEDEIKAYGEALLLEPYNRARSRLLANRAEAYMALGEITLAVEGYRAALSVLSSIEMFGSGVTALWGLAVALDRAGDLDAGLDAVRLARTYDPIDKHLNGQGWFYSPPYDKFYYRALGHWSNARSAELGAAKAEGYLQAIAAWAEFIATAAPDDHWLPIAKARLRQCDKEWQDQLRALRIKDSKGKAAPAPTPFWMKP